MNKPKYIQANYTRTIEFNLQELGIDWDKVKDFSVKYNNLIIYYKDGTEKSFTNCSDWEENIFNVFDEDWDKVEEKEDE